MVRKMLLDCGINPACKGFAYFEDAIPMRAEDRTAKLLDGILADVARKNGVSVCSVERSMRSALISAIDHHGPEGFINTLGQAPNLSGTYTLGGFLSLCAMRI